MSTTNILTIYLWGCGFAAAIFLTGFMLVRKVLVSGRTLQRHSLPLALLLAASGLWLLENFGQRPHSTALDLLTLFLLFSFLCFFLFWAGVLLALKQRGHRPGHEDFLAESSILPMHLLDGPLPELAEPVASHADAR